jgi:hypothetical protein
MRKTKTQKRGFPKKQKIGSSTTKPMRASRAGESSSPGADVSSLMSDAMASASGRGTISSGKKMDLKDQADKTPGKGKKRKAGAAGSVNRFSNY